MASANIGTIRGKLWSRRLWRCLPHAFVHMRIELLDQLLERAGGSAIEPVRATKLGSIVGLRQRRHCAPAFGA